MGRKKLPEDKKKQGIYMKFSPWVKKWLRAQNRSQGVIAEEAIIKQHKLKDPER